MMTILLVAFATIYLAMGIVISTLCHFFAYVLNTTQPVPSRFHILVTFLLLWLVWPVAFLGKS
jgi:hypothetical protein